VSTGVICASDPELNAVSDRTDAEGASLEARDSDFRVTPAADRRWIGSALPRPDLRELVEAAQAGDVDAWEELYLTLHPRLLSYARHHVGYDGAPDAVSEAMVRAVAGLSRFRWKDAGFEAWLFRILRHVVIDHHRRNGRERRLDTSAQRDRHEDDTAESLLADEEAVTVRKAFHLLRAADQELLRLRVVAGLSSEEVAEVLGKRPGAIRMGQVRALQRLRAILDASEVAP
jgi:RNA polymerase sigma-70 factor (ECF subfamily)